MFITMQEYSGPRIVNYRRRKLVIAYFTNDNTLKVACATKIPQIANSPFKSYIKTEIDCKITSAKNQEKDRMIHAMTISVEYDYETLHKFFSAYGKITRLSIVKKRSYNVAYVVYEDPSIISTKFKNIWYLYLKKDTIRIIPLNLSPEKIKQRTNHIIKLAKLPLFIYAKDLQELIKQINGIYCFVSRNSDDYSCNYAYIRFKSHEDLVAAITSRELIFKGKKLYFTGTENKICYNCGNPNHELKSCKEKRQMYKPLSRNAIINNLNPVCVNNKSEPSTSRYYLK